MNIESHVTSHELSKQLAELGIKNKILFSWFETEKYGNVIRNSDFMFDLDEYTSVRRLCSAFLASELSEILPPNINNWGLCFDASSIITNKGIQTLWNITYADYDKKLMNELSDLKLSDAMAKMLIHLIEQKIWVPE